MDFSSIPAKHTVYPFLIFWGFSSETIALLYNKQLSEKRVGGNGKRSGNKKLNFIEVWQLHLAWATERKDGWNLTQ